MKEKDFRILALDGGGIRGAFAAKYLVELQKQAAKPLYRYFDLITGTSTGGLIAIALGLGISPTKILDLYKANADKIFSRRSWVSKLVGGFGTGIYDDVSLKEVLNAIFGDRRLGDSLTRLCIPAVDSATGRIKVYKTDHHPTLFKDYELLACEIAQGTAAAPFYFPSALVNGANLLDGGLWANNPSLIGLCEAMRMFKKSPQAVMILSVGTGEEIVRWDNIESIGFGKLKFSETKKLVKLVFCAQSQAVERTVEFIGPKVYKRINTILPSDFSLDDTAKIPMLERLADQKAQETVLEIKMLFLRETVTKFVPRHKLKGAKKREAQ